jgi:xanthine dehydrogenase accessory factor
MSAAGTIARLMHSDDVFFTSLTRHLQEKGRVALATVVETKGSGPSKVGRRFVIFDDGSFEGSIGGGPLRPSWCQTGRSSSATGGPARQVVRLLRAGDRIDAPAGHQHDLRRLGGTSAPEGAALAGILGGGHVGLALARFGRTMGYDVAAVDDRVA